MNADENSRSETKSLSDLPVPVDMLPGLTYFRCMPRLSLSLLSTFEATLDGRPLTGFESVKARALLAYVAVEANRAHTRASLAGLLWPELSEEAARTNLRQLLANLRQMLTIGDDTPVLLITRDTIQFNLDSDHQVDIASFRDLLRACDHHAHRRAEACRTCAARLTEAVTLYRGSFLQGLFVRDTAEFEEWVDLQRTAFHRRAIAALSRLTAYFEHRGSYAD